MFFILFLRYSISIHLLKILNKKFTEIIGNPTFIDESIKSIYPDLKQAMDEVYMVNILNPPNRPPPPPPLAGPSTNASSEKKICQKEHNDLNKNVQEAFFDSSNEDDEFFLEVPEESFLLDKERSEQKKKKEDLQKKELILYIKTDIAKYLKEKQIAIARKYDLGNHFRALLKQQMELDENIKFAKDELIRIDLELEEIQKSITEKENKMKYLLE